MSRQTPNGTYWKKRVLTRFPKAYCEGFAGKSFISFHVKNDDEVLGIGDTVRGAWKAAGAALDRTVKG